jgi:hypothetical protein
MVSNAEIARGVSEVASRRAKRGGWCVRLHEDRSMALRLIRRTQDVGLLQERSSFNFFIEGPETLECTRNV